MLTAVISSKTKQNVETRTGYASKDLSKPPEIVPVPRNKKEEGIQPDCPKPEKGHCQSCPLDSMESCGILCSALMARAHCSEGLLRSSLFSCLHPSGSLPFWRQPDCSLYDSENPSPANLSLPLHSNCEHLLHHPLLCSP